MAQEDNKLKFREAQEELILMRTSVEKGDRESALNHRNSAWLKLYELRDKYVCSIPGDKNIKESAGDIFDALLPEIIGKYSPGEGDLENYFNSIWARRSKDSYGKKKTITVGDEKIDVREESMDQETEEGDDSRSGKMEIAVSDDWSSDRVKVESDEYLLEIGTLIISLFEHGYTKSNNQAKEKFFKMIYTEKATLIFREIIEDTDYDFHEKQIFKAINTGFLDFYTLKVCRTVRDVWSTALKKNVEFGIKNNPDAEIDFPLNNRVYYCFFTEIEKAETSENSVSTRLTQQKENFNKLLRGAGITST